MFPFGTESYVSFAVLVKIDPEMLPDLKMIETFHENVKDFINFCDLFAPCAITMNEFKRLVAKRDKNIFDVLSPSDFAFLKWKLVCHLKSWFKNAKEGKKDDAVGATITADDDSSQTSALDHCRGVEESTPTEQPPAKKQKNQTKVEKISDFRKHYNAMKTFCEKEKETFGQAYIEHRRKIREEELANGGGDGSSGSGNSGLMEEADKPKVSSCLDAQWL